MSTAMPKPARVWGCPVLNGLQQLAGLGGLTSRRASGPAWSIVNGDGVDGAASIVSAGGDEWTVTSTGTPSGPWTVTTAQLVSGLPIKLEPQTVTTAAGPIYSVEVGDEPLSLCPTNDPAEYTYEWKRSGSTVGTGRTYDATADTGLLVESVITAFNGATGGVTGVESVVVAQAAAAEVLPVQFSDQKLTNATSVASGGARFFVATFTTPTPMVGGYLWNGGTGYDPRVVLNGDGSATLNIGVLYTIPAGTFSAGTKYSLFVCNSGSPGRRQVILQQGVTVTVFTNTTSISTAIAITANTIGLRNNIGGGQFTGQIFRMMMGAHNVNFADTAVREQFVDATGAVVLPSAGQAAVPDFEFDFYDKDRMEAGTNEGTFGNFTKTGSAFP